MSPCSDNPKTHPGRDQDTSWMRPGFDQKASRLRQIQASRYISNESKDRIGHVQTLPCTSAVL